MTRQRFFAGLFCCLWLLIFVPQSMAQDAGTELRVMAWNIWHGGREDGQQIGPKRVAEVIRQSGADLVAMQETYGSGEIISTDLGFDFHPRGTNVSIHSRYPVVEDISVFEEFKCVGALIDVPGNRKLAFYSIWLPYDAEIWEAGTRDPTNLQSMLDACQSSATELSKIWKAIQKRLEQPKYKGIPIVIAGDFNSMSHLDYSEIARDQHQCVVDWPTSQVLTAAGFRDSYREVNPLIRRSLDRTWTPRFPNQQQDRIDFIYYNSNELQATESRVIDRHAQKFPSDHAALLTTLRWRDPTKSPDLDYRVVSYNIRHGAGTDNKLDLDRVAGVLRRLDADFIGLQEVDNSVRRSGNVNQAATLGEQLEMHAAFGPFMKYQGGRYGMGLLSRFPIRKVQNVSLPTGNEPRVALAVEVRLPNGDSAMLVNVHFDWVEDDKFRFAQASKLTEFLDRLTMPYILLGDFNDQPASRTLDLFRSRAEEASKPAEDRLTFSSTNPRKEIDFIFCSPKSAWTPSQTKVITERLASDHRPVLTNLRYQPKRR